MYRDIVMRWIHTLSALIARLLRRDPGVTVELARLQLEDARSMLLGSLDVLLPHLEPAQVADLLVDPFRIHGYAQLLALESAIEQVADRPDRAAVLTERARALGREAVRRVDEPPPEWVEWQSALEREAGPAGE